jgi:diadenosine tetraphosphatase ApaH/serine/threonine PP2A family protein phosphatase
VKVAVLSDVHGNLPALQSVLRATERRKIDELWCLGDIVGYGADPTACIDLVRERAQLILAGNHDLVAAGRYSAEGFSRHARLAISWTAQQLDDEHREWLASLPSGVDREGIGLFHASPRDPVWEYVVDPQVARGCLDAQAERITMIGHSHLALSWTPDPADPQLAIGTLRPGGEQLDTGGERWILNPGSVGQPRDRDARAAWLEFDTASGRATWHRSSYDVTAAQRAIREAGLPDVLADRLGAGL